MEINFQKIHSSSTSKALWYLFTESKTAKIRALNLYEYYSKEKHDLVNVWLILLLGSHDHQYPLE